MRSCLTSKPAKLLSCLVTLLLFSGLGLALAAIENFPVQKTEVEWKKSLTPEQYNVLRKEGTEPPFSGQYDHFYKKGVYVCAGCHHVLFSSDAKFNSHTGWPSFYQPIAKKAVTERSDSSFMMQRTEVQCAHCGGHLGHVFNDGPKPTGLRYCMNSLALKFIPNHAK